MNTSATLEARDTSGSIAERRHGLDALQADRFADNDDVCLDVRSAPTSFELHAQLHARRTRMIAAALARFANHLWREAKHAWRRYRQYRQQRASCRELGMLDDRMLRDLGLDRSEIGSIAAEIAGTANGTRIRALRLEAYA